MPSPCRTTPRPCLPRSAQNNGPAAPAFSRDQTQAPATPPQPASTTPKPGPKDPVDANGNPIPIERREPQRILGFMPNFRTVSGGSKPHPPGFKYNFTVATHQATDYSSFIFLGLTSLTSEAFNEHPVLGKGMGGFYAYTWRGFLDKTDNTYLSAWLLPSILHEDTRYYALGAGHSFIIRPLYIISQEAVARTYGGRKTPNFAGLGGKAITQYVSRYYYPPSAATFGVLADQVRLLRHARRRLLLRPRVLSRPRRPLRPQAPGESRPPSRPTQRPARSYRAVTLPIVETHDTALESHPPQLSRLHSRSSRPLAERARAQLVP